MSSTPPKPPYESGEGDYLAPFRAACERAETAIMAAVEAEPDRVWEPRELHALSGEDGPASMTVLCRLTNPNYDDRLELTSRMKVRRRAR